VLDVWPGVSLHGDTIALGRIVAGVAENARIRWLYGSDKLLADHRAAHSPQASDTNAIRRFADPAVECVVCLRHGDESGALESCIRELEQSSSCTFVLVSGDPTGAVRHSASSIRAAYASGDPIRVKQAEAIEYGDLNAPHAPPAFFAQ
jgi:hypothetical protein